MAVAPRAGNCRGRQNPAYVPIRHALPILSRNARGGCVFMFLVGNFIEAVAKLLNIALSLYMWVIIARAVISWVNPDPFNPIVRVLYSITDPVLYAVRRRIPLFFGGIDFSPILVILAIIFLQSFLVQSLFQLSQRM